MMVLVALLIAVVAISLMMTVLVASARPLRGYDESVFGARSVSKGQDFSRNSTWTGLAGKGRQEESIRTPLPIQQYSSALPALAPTSSTASRAMDPQAISNPSESRQTRPVPRSTGRVNPNTWGRIRAEVGVLEARRQRAV